MNGFRLLRADELDCRISTVKKNGVSLLLYKDARCDMNILDETVGMMNWKKEYSRDNANCTVSIWDDKKLQWISKEDTGTESFTEKEKGLASDSFKRACFNWGIGRELYSAPFIWIPSNLCHIEPKGNGFTCYDRFKVAEIGYDESSRINALSIMSGNQVVYRMGHFTEEKPVESNSGAATEKERKRTFAMAMKKFDNDKEKVKQFYADNGVDYFQMTGEQYVKIVRLLADGK